MISELNTRSFFDIRFQEDVSYNIRIENSCLERVEVFQCMEKLRAERFHGTLVIFCVVPLGFQLSFTKL